MLYYSPEIITGQKYVGPEIDCWCLGILLFRMTAGFEPFGHARSKWPVYPGLTKQCYSLLIFSRRRT